MMGKCKMYKISSTNFRFTNDMAKDIFDFKQFTIHQNHCGMKVGTDGVLLGAWAAEKYSMKKSSRILDIGTGTGLIALMMAQRFPETFIDAIDIDEEACFQARENISMSPFADRIHVIHQSLQSFADEIDKETSLFLHADPSD